MNKILLAIIVTMTITLGLSLFFFSLLLKLNLKMKNELPKELKDEIEKNKGIYEFIWKKKFVNPEILVVEFQEINPRDPDFKLALVECMEELKQRTTGNKILVKIGNFYELSEDAKRYFTYESPTLKQLFVSVFG
jgi:hypothetical protein